MMGAKLANRLAAFKRLQRNAKLVGLPVLPAFLHHRSAPPRAWQFAPLYA